MICNCGHEVKKTYDLYPNEDEVLMFNWKEDEKTGEVYICGHCGLQWELLNKNKYDLTPREKGDDS